MPFLLAEILNFQCALHLKGVGSLSYKIYNAEVYFFAHKKEEELKWRYGEFEKDLE